MILPSYEYGDRRLLLMEALFIPTRLVVWPLIWTYQALGFVLSKILP